MDEQWAYDTWATADFGDLRLSARAIAIGAATMSRYEKSIPDRCETWAATKATYRFLDNARVSHGALQQVHWTFVMQEALAHEGLVLRVQDGSEMFFNSRRFLTGCGPTCNSLGNGMLLHSWLALKWHGSLASVIGLGFQSIWTRGEQTMLPRDGVSKESAVGRETLEARESS